MTENKSNVLAVLRDNILIQCIHFLNRKFKYSLKSKERCMSKTYIQMFINWFQNSYINFTKLQNVNTCHPYIFLKSVSLSTQIPFGVLQTPSNWENFSAVMNRPSWSPSSLFSFQVNIYLPQIITVSLRLHCWNQAKTFFLI